MQHKVVILDSNFSDSSCANSENQLEVLNNLLCNNSNSQIDDDDDDLDMLLVELCELRQIASIKEYYDEFDKVTNRMRLEDADYKAYLEIRCHVNMFDPINLNDAYSLANLHEYLFA